MGLWDEDAALFFFFKMTVNGHLFISRRWLLTILTYYQKFQFGPYIMEALRENTITLDSIVILFLSFLSPV